MTRLRADLLLLLAAIIWGTTFIAQKTGMEDLGPCSFIAARFILSFLIILPFAARERQIDTQQAPVNLFLVVLLCLGFTGGVIFQQIGLATTSVTNAGFLTGLYVPMTPLVVWLLWRVRPPVFVWIAGALAVAGLWFLNGGTLKAMSEGDLLVLLCAAFYAVQVALLGYIMQKTARPFYYSALQYGVCAMLALGLAWLYEPFNMTALWHNIPEILYAGVLSGGIAYTLQAVAQQHTPPSDAAIIMSSESLFAALAGAIVLGERIDLYGWAGCVLILSAILLVEVAPLIRRSLVRRYFSS